MMEIRIRREGDAWTIVADGRSRGRFAYRVDAEEAALRLADKAADQGGVVSIVIESGLSRSGAKVPFAAPAAPSTGQASARRSGTDRNS